MAGAIKRQSISVEGCLEIAKSQNCENQEDCAAIERMLNVIACLKKELLEEMKELHLAQLVLEAKISDYKYDNL